MKIAEPSCLYPSEAEIAVAVFGKKRAHEWSTLAAFDERHRLPRVDTMYGGRYWPAVKAYLDRRHRLSKDAPLQQAEGQENWDVDKPRARRRSGEVIRGAATTGLKRKGDLS